MSQTKVWLANKGNATRRATDGYPTQGSGDNKRLYVGRHTNYDYYGYLNFDFDWPTGKIVSAILTLTTDDGLGILGDVMAQADSPKVNVRRLTTSFSEHSGNETWDADDYTTPTATGSGGTGYKNVAPDQLGQTNIDITSIVEAWAPKTLKKRNGSQGGNASKHGIKLFSTTSSKQNAAFISDDAESAVLAYKPYITLTYNVGVTTPNTPTAVAPIGAVPSIGSFQGTFSDINTTDQMRYSEVQVYESAAVKSGNADTDNTIDVTAHGYTSGQEVWFHSLTGGAGLSLAYPYYVRGGGTLTTNSFTVSRTLGGAVVDITNNYSALTVAKHIYSVKQSESATAISNAIFDHVPAGLHLNRNVTYKWRGRVYDTDGSVSGWTSLNSFSVTNTDPDAPTSLTPSGSSYATLDGVQFTSADFTDPDAGDYLLAYEVQLSAYAEGDAHWLDDEFILWGTGKRYRSSGAVNWKTPYGGASLDAGTYYWRARVWDQHHGVSSWSYATVTLSADYEADPDFSINTIQMRPRAPWRIVIKAMGALRGPGTTVAVLEDAMMVGASLMYNSPGEAHFTLGAHHPQLSVIEVKQTHYSIQFRQGDGWREVFAGLMWDFDATDTEIVFYGIDYLALYDYVVDEQYKAANAEAAYNKGGSKYSTVAIRTIIADQLAKAKKLPNSPVGFITAATVPSALSTTVTVYSTYSPVLNFLGGLIESYRAGSGKFTRMQVKRTAENTYQFVVTDDPGLPRDNLRLRYGEMVQGFRIVPFGKGWGTRIAAIGRDKDGVKVRYTTQTATGISEATWGRFILPQFMDGVSDDNDLKRRAKQFITAAAMLGKQMGLGLRSGVLQPRDGYELLDRFPVDVKFGSVDTAQYGHDGYWTAVGITWQSKAQGNGQTTLTLVPQEEGSAPSADLLVAAPISAQAQWQVGWRDPNPLDASSRYWLNQSTGVVWTRLDGDTLVEGITGDV